MAWRSVPLVNFSLNSALLSFSHQDILGETEIPRGALDYLPGWAPGRCG